MSVLEPSAAERIRAATETLWHHSRDRVREQVTVIERAVMALLEDRLGNEERAAAQREAHKIAGSAGMFGFQPATEAARRLEQLFEVGPQSVDAVRASALVERMLTAFAFEDTAGSRAPHAVEASVPPSGKAPGLQQPSVVLVGLATAVAGTLSSAVRARGLVPELVHPSILLSVLEAGEVPAAAVVQLAESRMAATGDLVAALARRGVPVVVLVPEDTGTQTRITVLRAGARLLLDLPSDSPSGHTAVADALASLAGAPAAGGFRILAVDDDATLLLAVRVMLGEGLGAQVTTLSDTEQFWPELNRVQPDLLLIDIDMPGASGLELCRLVRSDPAWHGLPVVFLSARSDASTVYQVFASGADDFVSKPVHAAELHARVANRLERTKLQRQLSDTDPLTGLANWARLETELRRLQQLADRYQTSLSIAVLGLDRFQQVNDRYGHELGDTVLRTVGRSLRDAFRDEDVVARIGGDEFVVGMLGLRREEGAARLEGVLAALRDTVHHLEGHTLQVSASAGVAQYGVDGAGLEAVHRAAKAALRAAKTAGRGAAVPSGLADAWDGESVDVAIVEDDEILAELLRHTLTTVGYRCLVLPDGTTAVDRLTDTHRTIKARAILLDIDLPGRNGFEVLHELHRAGLTATSAVLVVTGRSSEEEVMRALRSGARDHVAKPFSVPLLVEKLRRIMPEDP